MNEHLRPRFEEVAHAHYLARWQGDENGQMSREEFCRRNADGTYFYDKLNLAWWGYQAGFVDGALAGS